MRWRFCETEEERARREATRARMDRFWTELAEVLDELPNRDPNEINAWMSPRLTAIAPRIMWEFRPAAGGDGHGFVLTAEGDMSLRPLVVELVARAPAIAGWEFYDDRVTVPAQHACMLVKARTDFEIRTWRVVPSVDNGKVHLTFVSPDPKHENSDAAWGAALCATQNLVGERRTEQWIGGIRIVPAMRKPALLMRKAPNPEAEGAVELEDLAREVGMAIEAMQRELPDKPRWQSEELDDGEPIGHTYNVDPEEADDYPGMSDVFAGATTDLRIVTAVRDGPFFSSSHSRCGETFCYVKLERLDPNDNDLSPRHALQDALQVPLQGVGAVTGGATGLRYWYIDLALTDLDRSTEIVRDVLRARGVPRRSWILFHDSELANEWLGVYPETPPPPA